MFRYGTLLLVQEPEPNKNAAVATEIRVLLLRTGHTQAWLADRIGIARPTLSKRMNGAKAWALDELAAVAFAFDIPLADLLKDAA